MSEDDDNASAPERRLLFLRHGIAEEKSADKPDEERSLTSEGHGEMMKIAQGVETIFPRAQSIWSSPLLRATQTAQWVAKAFRQRIKIQTTDALRSEASPKELVQFLEEVKDRRIILVGHEPNLTKNVMSLTHLANTSGVELKKGGCYEVRLREDGIAILEWLLSPRILKRLG